MIEFTNPEAARALWSSHNSVSQYVIRLYKFLLPQVVAELKAAVSKIHISFNRWTTKGGKRSFFGVVAHYATAEGAVKDLPIDLPQLSGVHAGERIASCIENTLRKFGITASKLGYFMLDNAYNNDAAIKTLGSKYGFVASHRRLRCSAHTINLVGQAVLFSSNKDTFDNDAVNLQDEERFLLEWRKRGPLGTLLDVINYIKTPQQHEVFRNFQELANRELPADNYKILEVVKPCVTRWNSYCSALERAVQLQPAFNSYIATRGNKTPEAPPWMRSGGLSANDWAVVNDYIEILLPLRSATKRLEGRGKSGRFGAIYEVLPVFEYLLVEFEQRYKPFELVDYEATNAPEDHLAINLKAAWVKLNDYYNRLDDSPVYYAATALHPYYKSYCDRAWRDKPSWLSKSKDAFQQLWSTYQVSRSPRGRPRERNPSAIDDAIAAVMEDLDSDEEGCDEYLRWRNFEPKWTKTVFESPSSNPVTYWVKLRDKYPTLARFAIDVLTIPATSCDCERMFSELGDLLAPRRRNIGSQLLAALQCIRSWMRDGKRLPVRAPALSDDDLDRLYDLMSWDKLDETGKYLKPRPAQLS
ncbi:hypothetical protein AA0111_g11924 [Alternaria arborescens]|uniref:hypothetical protein n=1 Tax=Alternaria arborescens TaxID=156630 RepID=UPI00107548B3|nr:hypothetical protein AA0111_g11924 [Alternaria arborescens]RYO14557.1 hypothetical protein AA0111_g11924 [Alternaria arborescens]